VFNKKLSKKVVIFIVFLFIVPYFCIFAKEKRALTFEDIMKFKENHDEVISDNGKWIAYNAQPDRGDGLVYIYNTETATQYEIERGIKPEITTEGSWVAVFVKPKAEEILKDKKKKKNNMILLNTKNGIKEEYNKIKKFSFAKNSEWVAFLQFEEQKNKKQDDIKEKEKENGNQKKNKKEKQKTFIFWIKNLKNKKKLKINNVKDFFLDPDSKFISLIKEKENKSTITIIELRDGELNEQRIHQGENIKYSDIFWSEKNSKFCFLSAKKNKDKIISESNLWIWKSKNKILNKVLEKSDLNKNWMIPVDNKLEWTEDGKRINLGLKPKEEYKFFYESEKPEDNEKEKKIEVYNREKILEDRKVNVWHWDDHRIIPNQIKIWKRLKKKKYISVYHVYKDKLIQLADREMPDLQPNGNADYTVGYSRIPYLKQMTWDGWFRDVYVVNLKTGEKKKILNRFGKTIAISPKGKYVVYYREKNWYLYDIKNSKKVNLTKKISTPFYNEDHDYPSEVPSYGIAGWIKDDKGVMIYDKYDIWTFDTSSYEYENLTSGKGRENSLIYRIIKLDKEKKSYSKNEKLLLDGYYNLKKNNGFFMLNMKDKKIESLLEGKKKYRFIKKAKRSDCLLYTRESFKEFPDIWITNLDFSYKKRISNVNPQIKNYLWGEADLVEWRSDDGLKLQGVLIKPANYKKEKRYPVIVYYYHFFSQRLYEFNQMVVNHRPNFPYYTSNGYAVFLPDVKFKVGTPGFSATKCLVPGVQKIIDIGIADPDAVGLHGHSWSGYQTAFVITQTDIFSAAVAGAPVSNMTSAYSGIRWGSGLARQFQYEKSQSRIGGSLWEYPERYLENSPVFFADRINTPLLIEFGDKDGAVPWYQGIELYLAMRRLKKDCVFLQYINEPHHLKQYPNKLDYSIKMKEYFDHYLKGEEAPKWIKEGIPYKK